MDQQSKVAVIGAGVMGEALIAALISSGVNPDRITISEKREERAQELVAKYAIKVAPVSANVADADALLLVVKPQDMATVLEDVKGSINPKAVVITFAAGKTISFISNGLGTSNPVVRVMPNTPTLVGKGMAAEIAYEDNNLSEAKIFQCGFPPIDNQNRISFYQILLNGKASLLKSVYKSIQERNNDLSGERFKEFATYENLYLLKEGTMTRIKKDKSSLLALFQDKKEAIAKYIEDQKLNLKNEAHLKALVQYYNTL